MRKRARVSVAALMSKHSDSICWRLGRKVVVTLTSTAPQRRYAAASSSTFSLADVLLQTLLSYNCDYDKVRLHASIICRVCAFSLSLLVHGYRVFFLGVATTTTAVTASVLVVRGDEI